MITLEKLMLLINDPKFRSASSAESENERQQTLNKIYANRKQIRRSKVVQECLVKKEQLKEVDTALDFLQSKLTAVQTGIVTDVEQTYQEKEVIEQRYRAMEDVYGSAVTQYSHLMGSVSNTDTYEKELENIEKQVREIKELHAENLFLKSMNHEIKKRIKEKQQKAKVNVTP